MLRLWGPGSLTAGLVAAFCLLTGLLIGQSLSGSPADTLAFVSDRSGSRDLYLLDTRVHHLIQLTDSHGSETAPAWSLDGHTLAFARLEGDSYDLYTLDIFTGERRVLVSTGAMELSPSWSPDARQLVFTTNRESTSDLYLITLADAAEIRLDDHPARDLTPVWSPDGTRIAYLSNRDRGFDTSDLNLQVLDLASGQTRPVRSSYVISAPAWSPDSTRLAFASTQALTIGRNEDLFAVRLSDGETINLTRHPARDFSPAWSQVAPEGTSWLAFTSNRDGNYELYSLMIKADGQPGHIERLTVDPAYDDFPAWRPQAK